MRSPPASTVDLPAPGGWRLVVLGLWGLAAAAWTGWILGPAPDLADPWLVVLAGCGGLCLIAALRLLRLRAVRLHWDGEQWLFGEAGTPLDQLRPGRLRVMFDLSGAMLLRLQTVPPGRRAVFWIPVARSGLGARWSAWRLTVYSAPQTPPPPRSAPTLTNERP